MDKRSTCVLLHYTDFIIQYTWILVIQNMKTSIGRMSMQVQHDSVNLIRVHNG